MSSRKIFLCILTMLPLLHSCLLPPQPFDEKQWRNAVLTRDPVSLYAPHARDGVFFNPWMPLEKSRFPEFLRWRFFSARPAYTKAQESFLPEVLPNLLQRINKLPPEENLLAWIGHATFLLRIDGIYFLTDPMLSKRALIPKRVTSSAITKDELAKLGGPLHVLISHNHYDHLDKATIEALPDTAVIHVPLGLKKVVVGLHPGTVHEYDWWDEGEIPGGRLTCLPVQHWSRRIGQGYNTTLWAGFMLRTAQLTVFYCGDSGYFIGFTEFARKFPSIDYALLPTTAYHPRWFMHYPHMNVEEALAAFKDLRARYFVPTQWGTFRLGDNPPGLPMLELNGKIREQGLDEKRYLRLRIGEITPLEARPDVMKTVQ